MKASSMKFQRSTISCAFSCVLAAGVAMFAHAADIEYAGGTDLNDGATWEGGVTPGAEDIAIIDGAKIAAGVKTLTITNDLSLLGLRVTNIDRMLTINVGKGGAESPTLSLGACGFTNTSFLTTAVALTTNFEWGVTFRAPMATTAAQTWHCGRQCMHTYCTLAGTETLTIYGGSFVRHYNTLGYGGKLIYEGPTISYSWIRTSGVVYSASGRWAQEVELKGMPSFLAPTNDTSWATLFGNRKLKNSGWNGFYFTCRKPGEGDNYPNVTLGHIAFTDGDVLESNAPVGITQGYLDQTGGSITINGKAAANYLNYYFGDWCNFDYPAQWLIAGGKLKANSLETGMYCTKDDNRYFFRQTGGEVEAVNFLKVGTGNQGSEYAYGEYKMEGGVLKLGLNSTDSRRGLKIMCCDADQTTSYQQGIYTQTGGDVYANRISVGAEWADKGPRHNHFGLFDLKGGTFHLGGEGFSVSKYFHDSVTNSTCNFRFRGGTLAAMADFTSTCPWSIAPSANGSASIFDTPANTNMTVCAQVRGHGEMAKTGKGRLVVADATRFLGSLDVREGTFEVAGTIGDDVGPTDHCWKWTADSLVTDGVQDGEMVTNWVDEINGVAAKPDPKNQSFAVWQGKVYYWNITNPVLRVNKYNGHAGLEFSDRKCISVPAATNPLNGKKAVTLVAVIDRQGNGGGNAGSLYYQSAFLGGPNAHYSGDNSAMFALSADGRVTFGRCYGATGAGQAAVSKKDLFPTKSGAHVVIGVTYGQDVILYVDGVCATNVKAKAEQALFTNIPLHIGGSFPDEINFSNASGAILAEVRAYDRALTHEECTTLNNELVAKYHPGDDSMLLKSMRGHEVAVAGELTNPAIPDPAETVADWSADTLAATTADGAEVTEWKNIAGDRSATLTEAGAGASKGPTFVKDAGNGHGALRFSSADKTGLAIPAADAPTAGAANFTAAVVFRSTVSGNTSTWKKSDISIISGDMSVGCPSFAVRWGSDGAPFGCWCTSWKTHRRPFRLDDGAYHVAIVSYANGTGTLSMFDGAFLENDKDCSATLKSAAVMLGTSAKDDAAGHFDGDIAAFRLYNRALTKAEATALCDWYGSKYGVGLLCMGNSTYSDLVHRGLGATKVTVAAGATLRVPKANTDPYTIGEGKVLTLKGKVEGTLRLTDGAKVVIDPATVGSVDKLVASGVITLDVAGDAAARKAWTPLFKVGELSAAGAVWSYEKGEDETAIEVRDGVLGISTKRGFQMIIK